METLFTASTAYDTGRDIKAQETQNKSTSPTDQSDSDSEITLNGSKNTEMYRFEHKTLHQTVKTLQRRPFVN